jgi:hypothetical protein
MSEQTCQHAFGKSTEASWRWCRLCGLPEAVVLLEAAEAEAARWKANDAASTEVIATTTVAWNAAEARATAAEGERNTWSQAANRFELFLREAESKLAAAERREAEAFNHGFEAGLIRAVEKKHAPAMTEARATYFARRSPLLQKLVNEGLSPHYADQIALASPSTPSPAPSIADLARNVETAEAALDDALVESGMAIVRELTGQQPSTPSAPSAEGEPPQRDDVVALFEHVTALYVVACQQPQTSQLRKRLSEIVRDLDAVGQRLSGGVWAAGDRKPQQPPIPGPQPEAGEPKEAT